MKYLAAVGLVLSSIVYSPVVAAQAPVADPRDVGTVEGVMHAYYDVINGPPGAPRQWRRDSTLYMPGVLFVAMSVDSGKPKAWISTPDQYRSAVNGMFVKYGFYETEIGSHIDRFGNVAELRSVYETRRAEGGKLFGRGVNYVMLYWDGTRWWISAASWDDERPDNPIPASWIGVHEHAP
ncbi:MAG: hypothetical protein ABI765_07620 [Gemmatimonadota bacterium]